MSLKSILTVSLLLTSLVSAIPPKPPRGVSRSKAHVYLPMAEGTWHCIDGSKEILYSQINDDYCDCDDGSDEPGTAACPNGMFHCTNAGHIPANIPSSHVNDGICDPLCCDGSDEYDGQITCPNTCRELGARARKEAAENAKKFEEGGRIRESYIEKAKQKKNELEAEHDRLNTMIAVAEEKERDLKVVLERAETRESKISKFGEKIADRARKRINEYKQALTALRDEIEYISGRLGTLEGILEDLKNNHNQNYHDMAVKAAVSAWDELKAETSPEWQITAEQLDNLEKETVDLGDDDVDFSDTNEFDETVSLLFRIQDYFPAQVTDFIKQKMDYIRAILVEQGIIAGNKPNDGPTVSRALQKARDAHAQAVSETSRLRNQVKGFDDQLSANYGPDDIFLAVKDECSSVDTGEYTYTVCFMGQVSQKSNKDGTNTSLGTFSRFEDDFGTLIYEHGLRCWNGPERSAKVQLQCGSTNEVIKVTEPSKCEYVIKMKSPIVCDAPQRYIKRKDEL